MGLFSSSATAPGADDKRQGSSSSDAAAGASSSSSAPTATASDSAPPAPQPEENIWEVNKPVERRTQALNEESHDCLYCFWSWITCGGPGARVRQLYVNGKLSKCMDDWSRLKNCMIFKMDPEKDMTVIPGPHPVWRIRTRKQAAEFWQVRGGRFAGVCAVRVARLDRYPHRSSGQTHCKPATHTQPSHKTGQLQAPARGRRARSGSEGGFGP